MPVLLSYSSLKNFFDSNPSRYKSTTHYGVNPLEDGYLPSSWLDYQLCTPDGNTATKPNRVAVCPLIPKPFSASDLFGSNGIGEASAIKIMASPSISKITEAIASQDRESLNNWAILHQAAGNITSDELTIVQDILGAVIPDPSWSPNIPISDLEAFFVDGQGHTPVRLELARNPDGSLMCTSAASFIDISLGRT